MESLWGSHRSEHLLVSQWHLNLDFKTNTWNDGNVIICLRMLLSPTLDSGGSIHMALNPIVVKNYYAQVPGSWDNSGKGTEWTVPCNATLPDLTLNVGGGSALIPGKALVNQQKLPDVSSKPHRPNSLNVCAKLQVC